MPQTETHDPLRRRAALGGRQPPGRLAVLLAVLALLPALLPALLLALPAREAQAQQQPLHIAVVNMNRALNVSEAGERSKKILLASKGQKENELKAKEAQLKKLAEDTKNNIMLTEAARTQREQDLRMKETELRQDLQSAQRELADEERKLTESIFTELRAVVGVIAQEKKYDLVLEQAASQVLLYSRFTLTDITDDVIQRYNKIQSGKG